MNIDQFLRLGDEVRTALGKVHWDEKALPDIAANALEKSDLEVSVGLDQISEFLISTAIKQQPKTTFSDLPLVVYRCEEFYIELLLWTNSTTAIHQHAFSGAFRVLAGSSFHSVWNFQERQRLSSRLLIGDCRFESAEILHKGDVRRIHSGRDGLLHALFHLDQPSLTVVVRNSHEAWAAPQYSLDPPHIAFALFELEADATVSLLGRLLGVGAQIEGESPAELLTAWCDRLDFPRLYAIVNRHHQVLSGKSDWERFMTAAEKSHGPLARRLEVLVQSAKRRSSIAAARNSIKDPDLRFFLALLSNVPSRDWMFRILRSHYPSRAPEDFCLNALKQLRNAESASAAFLELAKQARVGQDRLGTRLSAAIALEADDPRIDVVLRNLINGDFLGPPGEAQRLSESHEGSDEVMAALSKLRQLSELAPFFA